MENIKTIVLTNSILKEVQHKAWEIVNYIDSSDVISNNASLDSLIFVDAPFDDYFEVYVSSYDGCLEDILEKKDTNELIQYINYINDIYPIYSRVSDGLKECGSYTILERECYHSGGGIYIGHIAVKKDNDLYIFNYSDGSGYGCYKTSYEKGLKLRNTKDLLAHFDMNGYPSFGDILSDSDILNENFEFVESDEECDPNYEKEIYEYLYKKVDDLLNPTCSEEDLIFNEIKAIRDAYPCVGCEVTLVKGSNKFELIKQTLGFEDETYLFTDYILMFKDELMDITNDCIRNQRYDDTKEVMEDLKKLDDLKIKIERVNYTESNKNKIEDFIKHMYDVLEEGEKCDFKTVYDFKIQLKDRTIDVDFDAENFHAIEMLLKDNLSNL